MAISHNAHCGNLFRSACCYSKRCFYLGANKVALLIAEALRQAGFEVLLADMHWGNIAAARLQGFQCYYGNVFTAYAGLHLDLSQYGTLLALAPQNEWNMLAMWHFQAEFGRKDMFMIASEAAHSKQLTMRNMPQMPLFTSDISFGKLLQMVQQGVECRFTKITDQYNVSDFEASNHAYIPLFSFNDKQHIHIIMAGDIASLKPGWTLVTLMQN